MINSHYKDFDRYVKKKRWVSYWHQISEVLAIKPETVLLIGIGNGVIPAILQEKGIKVYTFDYDASMNPDFCSDIRKIGETVGNLKVDAVLCCQVLEHVEFEYFEEIMNVLHMIANKRVVLSLPHCHLALSGWVRGPVFQSFEWKFIIPCFWFTRCFFNDEHHWEVGMKNYSKKRIEKILTKKFSIVDKYHVTMNPYHLF